MAKLSANGNEISRYSKITEEEPGRQVRVTYSYRSNGKLLRKIDFKDPRSGYPSWHGGTFVHVKREIPATLLVKNGYQQD